MFDEVRSRKIGPKSQGYDVEVRKAVLRMTNKTEEELHQKNLDKLGRCVTDYVDYIRRMWTTANRSYDNFAYEKPIKEKKVKAWLAEPFPCPFLKEEKRKTARPRRRETNEEGKVKSRSFISLKRTVTSRQIRRVKQNLRGPKMRDGDGRKNDQKILMTARQILKKKGGQDAADLFDIVNDPKLAKEAMAALRKGVAENVDPTEALAYVMNQSLSRSRYLAEKKMDKKHKGKNLPYWGKVLVRNLLL